MKRISVVIVIFLLLSVALIYVFIPEKLVISSASSFNANREGVYRFLINDSDWQKWWPGNISKSRQGTVLFSYKDYDFEIGKILYDVIQLKLRDNGDTLHGSLKVVPYSIDSIGIELSSELNTGSNPVGRISGYLRAKKIKHALDNIVLSLRNYASDMKNIYGISIKNEKVQFQHLLTTKETFSHYPTTSDVYAIIGKLRNYMNKAGAMELFSPMLNIKMTDSVTYVAQVGLPIDKDLPETGNINSKWMMKGGNILVGEITGGRKEIDEAAKQFEIYIRDHQRAIIAIPFQMLITDRTKEPDSTKWVTRLYYPVV